MTESSGASRASRLSLSKATDPAPFADPAAAVVLPAGVVDTLLDAARRDLARLDATADTPRAEVELAATREAVRVAALALGRTEALASAWRRDKCAARITPEDAAGPTRR